MALQLRLVPITIIHRLWINWY